LSNFNRPYTFVVLALLLFSMAPVEDQLAALQFLAGESQSQANAVLDATRAEEIAMQRFRAGLVGYLDVVFAQETEISDERAATQISGQQMVASVVLIKALGRRMGGRKHTMMANRLMTTRRNVLGCRTCLSLFKRFPPTHRERLSLAEPNESGGHLSTSSFAHPEGFQGVALCVLL
jgi:hypothetical protein